MKNVNFNNLNLNEFKILNSYELENIRGGANPCDDPSYVQLCDAVLDGCLMYIDFYLNSHDLSPEEAEEYRSTQTEICHHNRATCCS